MEADKGQKHHILAHTSALEFNVGFIPQCQFCLPKIYQEMKSVMTFSLHSASISSFIIFSMLKKFISKVLLSKVVKFHIFHFGSIQSSGLKLSQNAPLCTVLVVLTLALENRNCREHFLAMRSTKDRSENVFLNFQWVSELPFILQSKMNKMPFEN